MTYDPHYAASTTIAGCERIHAPRSPWWMNPECKRTMPPPDFDTLDYEPDIDPPERVYHPGDRHDRYHHIYCTPSMTWRGRLIHQKKTYYTGTRKTPLEAARAFNRKARALGVPEHRLIDLREERAA